MTDITFTEVYPYDAATFASAPAQRVNGTATGFNVGADVGKRFARHAGIGGGVRFSRATISLAVPNSTTTVSVKAGGVAIAAGLRLYF